MNQLLADNNEFAEFNRTIKILSVILIFSTLIMAYETKIRAIVIESQISEMSEAVELMPPEQALRLLNEKLKKGMITEEEYNAQRADIINNL